MLAIMVDFEKKSSRSKDQMVLKIADQRTGIRNDLYKRTLYRFEGSEKILQRTLKTAQERKDEVNQKSEKKRKEDRVPSSSPKIVLGWMNEGRQRSSE